MCNVKKKASETCPNLRKDKEISPYVFSLQASLLALSLPCRNAVYFLAVL
jgi:hypothetical protein